MNPDDKLGDATVAEVQELIREQVANQISTSVKASFDTLREHLDSYFAPGGAVGKLTAGVRKLSDDVRELDQQTKAQGLAILRLEKRVRGDGDPEDQEGLLPRPPASSKLGDPSGSSASTLVGSKAKAGAYPGEKDAKEGGHNNGQFRFPKIDLYTYDGKEDPLPWLTRCDEYFSGRAIPEIDRTWMAAVHLTGVGSLWYRHLKNR
ncbi:unnamed protein product [Alopecurus aequalis]